MKKLSKFYLSLLCTVLVFQVSSQSRSDLEKERNKLLEQIEDVDELLKENEKKSKSSIKDLKAIEQKIKSREKLLTNLKSEIIKGQLYIKENQDSVNYLQKRLETLEYNYQKLIRLSYLKNKSTNKWMYLFSSNSVNDLILRFRYNQHLNQFITEKKKQVSETTLAIENTNALLNEETTFTDNVLAQEQKHVKLLEDNKLSKKKIVDNLKKEESSMRKKLKEQEKYIANLNTKIENIILKELNNKTKKTTKSTAFISNGLAWPVNRGFISSKFGKQAHPTIQNLEINNNGIDISSSPDASVMAVADGVIIGTTNIPGFDIMVIIDHGGHFTVYSKLEITSVKKNQKINSGDIIGSLSEEGILHFEIWKNDQKLDPQKWLKKR